MLSLLYTIHCLCLKAKLADSSSSQANGMYSDSCLIKASKSYEERNTQSVPFHFSAHPFPSFTRAIRERIVFRLPWRDAMGTGILWRRRLDRVHSERYMRVSI